MLQIWHRKNIGLKMTTTLLFSARAKNGPKRAQRQN